MIIKDRQNIFLSSKSFCMQINMISGMSTNRVIGHKNQLPRHYSEDLKHFKNTTTGHTIVMGYNTYKSIGKPLPNRRNIVISYQPIEWVETYDSIPSLIAQLTAEWVSEIFVIGWAMIYQQFLPMTDRIYLTEIKKTYIWDTYFPIFEDQFTEVGREVHEEMDFVIYERT